MTSDFVGTTMEHLKIKALNMSDQVNGVTVHRNTEQGGVSFSIAFQRSSYRIDA